MCSCHVHKQYIQSLPVTTLKSPIFVILLQLTTVKCELSTWTSEISLMYLVWLLASDTTLFNSELFISSLNNSTFLVTTNCHFFRNTLSWFWLEWRKASYDLRHFVDMDTIVLLSFLPPHAKNIKAKVSKVCHTSQRHMCAQCTLNTSQYLKFAL